MTHSNQLYLSVVVTARNDDHGGNLLGRMQIFVNGLMEQCARHRIPAELILVEWNPPAERPRLADALRWPDSAGFCDVRILEVPLALHQRYKHWQAMPLYQMIAKNVGIRRARGEFVLATNIDILFSEELMQFIGRRSLDPSKMYRVDRWDAMANVPADAPLDQQLAYCASHVIRVNRRGGTFRLESDQSLALEPVDIAQPDGAIRLMRGWFDREMSGDEPFRWADTSAEIVVLGDSPKSLTIDVEPGPSSGLGPLELELQDESGKALSMLRIDRRSQVTFALPAGRGGRVFVRLHARNYPIRIASDLRILSFRVFRCSLDAPHVSASDSTAPATVRSVHPTRSRVTRGWRLLRQIMRGNPDVHIRLPLSRERLAKLQLRQDSGGVSFSARGLRAGRSGAGIVPEGAHTIWGWGWYPLEHFSGETFRWMAMRSRLAWLLPDNCPRTLILRVEPGPAVGFKPCDVEIRDAWGRTLGVHKVSGRSEIHLPVNTALTGALGIEFVVRGGGALKPPGEERELALRLLACEWGAERGESPLVEPAWSETSPGIWCGRGWLRVEDPHIKGLPMLPGAQLLIRAPEGKDLALAFEFELPANATAPVDLAIEDGAGAALLSEQLAHPAILRLPDNVTGGAYCALRIARKSAKAPAKSTEPFLLLRAIHWEDVTGVKSRVEMHKPATEGPVALHTNACGDFTLVARDRWLDLRGYPELDMYSMNIDSVFCFMAHHGGAREEMLAEDMRIYHIEHGSGSGWTPEGAQKLFDRMMTKGISWLEFREVLDWARLMNRFDMPMILNREDWGLANEVLREITPAVKAAAR